MPSAFAKLVKHACIAVPLAASACAADPPIVLHRPAATAAALSRPHIRRTEPCQTPVQTKLKLSDAQKTNLFQQFEAYERDRRPAGSVTEVAVPPPGPLPSTKAPLTRSCSKSAS